MKTITLTDEQYQALCAGESITIEPPKPKQWGPKKGPYFIGLGGHIIKSRVLDEEILSFGQYYQTKEAAEKARDAMRTHNRLLSWLSENDDGWLADWDDSSQGKYFIHSKPKSEGKKYRFTHDWECKDLAKVYMSRENAIKLCKLLNSGEVIL